MKSRPEDRKAMLEAVIESAASYGIPKEDVRVWEDDEEAYSVGYDYKGYIAVGIDLGFRNGVETAFSASYQDLEFPTDGFEEADTIEEAINIMEGWCEYADENHEEEEW